MAPDVVHESEVHVAHLPVLRGPDLLQPPPELLRVGLRCEERLVVPGGDLPELRAVEGDDVALREGLHLAAVDPAQPQRGLAAPLVLVELHDLPLVRDLAADEVVDSAPPRDEVHVVSFHSAVEDRIGLREGVVDQGLEAELADRRHARLAVGLEEGVHVEARRVELRLQLDVEGAGEQVQELDLRRVEGLLLALHDEVRVPGDAGEEAAGDLALSQELLEQPVLRRPVAIHGPDGLHQRGDAADEAREYDHAEDEHEVSEDELERGLRHDLRGAGRELGQ
mmetsp:Transcript_47397/g.139958  ORF Transcript_47397/g.139958 Transcript_47397/m.139958 type:complete len:281 (-) Transcript_47397:399-1241(-)